jgi:hypothetical protein
VLEVPSLCLSAADTGGLLTMDIIHRGIFFTGCLWALMLNQGLWTPFRSPRNPFSLQLK